LRRQADADIISPDFKISPDFEIVDGSEYGGTHRAGMILL
jgi:hypothetical protein